MKKTILVSNRLPVRIDAQGQPERTTGGLASALAGAEIDALWVGWPGAAAEDIADLPAVSARLRALGLAPVFLGRDALDAYYEGYSNATLWPLLHSMATRAQFRAEWYAAYEAVNRRFVEVILEHAEPGDTVWIHDFHLFLVPALLREACPGLHIGFFLHTPFPSSELLRILPERRSVLEGLLGADLIGFHTYSYLRHFRSSLLRVLGIESEMDSVRCREHTAWLGVHPIGHDHVGFKAAIDSPEFELAFAAHGAELGARQLVLGVERLDYTKGIPQKLAAIRRFLSQHPEWRRRAIFVLIAVPSRKGIREYDDLTEEVQREVGALNGEFGAVGHVPVQFLHQSFPQAELAALYALADVCVVTPLVDGMNLVAKEFVACKATAPMSRPGVLVLSEFAGAAHEMSDALLVNPYDVDTVARTIVSALEMSEGERRQRIDAMGPRIVHGDAAAWARKFLLALAEHAATPGAVQADGTLRELAHTLAAQVREGAQLALFLDYDGTLREFTGDPAAAVPDAGLLALLAALAAHPRVDLAIVSGRPSDFLQHHLGDLDAALVAEHGFRRRVRRGADWEIVQPEVNTSWKVDVRPLLEQAVELTPGTTLEEKRSALVWHYRRADPEFGAWRANMLLSELVDATASLPVVVHHGRKIVEVASQLVSKGAAVRRLVQERRPTVALAAGDDQTDETMFALELDGDLELHTIGVGDGPSRAQRRSDIAGLRAFLEELRLELQPLR
ncbi:MAG: bifunctional alpha,alpha-trehalose-phosphate synthase (UDP-forming)/trehalose-phosphatase [Planctomycetota bacterium]